MRSTTSCSRQIIVNRIVLPKRLFLLSPVFWLSIKLMGTFPKQIVRRPTNFHLNIFNAISIKIPKFIELYLLHFLRHRDNGNHKNAAENINSAVGNSILISCHILAVLLKKKHFFPWSIVSKWGFVIGNNAKHSILNEKIYAIEKNPTVSVMIHEQKKCGSRRLRFPFNKSGNAFSDLQIQALFVLLKQLGDNNTHSHPPTYVRLSHCKV